jgi:hypothetical protein
MNSVTIGDSSLPSYSNTTTISGSASFTYNPPVHGQVVAITLTGAGTITFAAPTSVFEGAVYKFILKAGDTSSRVFAWNSLFKWPSGVPAVTYASTNTNAVDVITFVGGSAGTMIYQGSVLDVR